MRDFKLTSKSGSESIEQLEVEDCGFGVLYLIVSHPMLRKYCGIYLSQSRVRRLRDWLTKWLYEQGAK